EGGRLKDFEIAALEKWVRDGAVDPRTKDAASRTSAAGRDRWACRPITSPTPPLGNTHPVDAFVAAKWQDKLQPVPRADKRALIRRATFDLTGLPPTPEEVQAFLADKSPEAFREVIDRLLASPQYGEKWGRHWLDV